MVGQLNIKEFIRGNDARSFPDVLLLVGEVGSGRRTLIREEIAPLTHLDVRDLTDTLSYEGIGNLYVSSIPFIYVIDMDGLSIKKQNILLKFLENPPNGSKVVLLAANESDIIHTVFGRCFVLHMEPYTDAELSLFCSNPNILKSIRTPGMLLDSFIVENIVFVKDLARNVLTKSKSATLSNLLSVSSNISFDISDKSKVYISTFNTILAHEAFDLFKDRQISNIKYNLVRDFVNRSSFDVSVFEAFLTELKFL